MLLLHPALNLEIAMNKLLKKALIASIISGLAMPVQHTLAEDTDIYAANTSAATNPNILIVIDNSANWNAASQHWAGGIKQGQSELNAMRTVIGELSDNINLGLMMFTPGSGSTLDGGYIRYHIRQMTTTNKSAFQTMLGSSTCTNGTNSLNGTPNCIYNNFSSPSEEVGTAKTDYSASMFEVFKYFGGYTSPAHATDDTAGTPSTHSQFGAYRYAGNPETNSDAAAYNDTPPAVPYAIPTPTSGSIPTYSSKLNYNSPLSSTNSCAKNFVIFIGNGYPTQDSASSLLTGVGGNATQLSAADFALTTSTQQTTLGTGVYASQAACESAAAITYGTSYDSYSCAVNSTSTSSTTTALGTSSCGQYASASACATAESASHSSYNGGVSCTVASSACTYTPTLNVTTACISDSLNNAGACTDYGNTHYPGYSGYNCSGTSCGSGTKTWSITGTGASISTGATYTLTGTTNTTTTTYNIIGNINLTAYTPTGTFSSTVANNADEWARFLNQTDVNSAPGKQNITTYTIDVFNASQDVNESKLLNSMAKNGGGKYFIAKNETAILDALRKIFAEIQSVNSVFASSSLPVSVNTQGTYLNQVFTGMFRPDGSAKPRWAGNLKQYKFKFFNGTLRLADKNGDEAVSSTTGFITPCANSFWTTDTGTYWTGSNALGNCTATGDLSSYPVAGSPSFYSDAPDGDVVEKGGAAQRLRGVTLSGGVITTSTNYSVRALKTCDGSSAASCTSLTDFNTANAAITTTLLGVSTTTDRNNLINWVRGQDLDDENANQLSNEMRPSAHGGVIHSQPAVIDYGGSIGVVSFYGDDEGVFHAIDGGQTDSEGTELWGFIAPETYSRLFRQKDNGTTTALINFPGVSGSVAKAPKDYFFDGSIGVYQKSSTGTVWIYPSMRRGGRAIYAFDVSTPSAPSLKWRKGCFTNSTADDSVCTSLWSAIGQTWSKPQIAYLNGYVDGSNNPKPVLVFGGGYDTCEDTDSQTRCTTTPRKGANVWFVDADDGSIITTYSTNYSVPGDIFLLKDSSGYLKYAYAADTGGYVYRINAGTYNGTTLTGWSAASQITIANLSETNQARKFIFGPDVVQYVGYNAVLLGTGDREHPLENSYACGNYSNSAGSSVTNQFYMIKDTLAANPTPIAASNLTDVSTNLTATEADIGASGFKFNLFQCEQVVNKPLTIGGIVYFGTNAPKQSVAASCANNLGDARGYAVDFLTANPVSVGDNRYTTYLGGGLPPSPVAGVVDVDGQKVPFIIGGTNPDDANPSPLQGSKVEINPTGPKQRVYWYLDTDSP
jgi:hypothetical protein